MNGENKSLKLDRLKTLSLQPLTMATFDGRGFLELGWPPGVGGLGEGTAFGFSFKSVLPDGVLVVSTWFAVTLKGGRLVVTVDNGPSFGTDDADYADGRMHTVTLRQTSNR